MKATSPYAYYADQLVRKDWDQLNAIADEATDEQRLRLQNIMTFVLGCHVVPESPEGESIQEQFPPSMEQAS